MPYGAPRIRAKKYTSHRSSLINKAPFRLNYSLLPYGISSTSIQTSVSPLSSFFAAIDEIGIGLVPILRQVT
jgi:hypothetical protein